MQMPKHYSLVAEHPGSFQLHDARTNETFHIAKHGLEPEMHEKLAGIQKFDDGGLVDGSPEEFVPGVDYSTAPLPGDMNSQPIYPDAPSGAQQLEAINNTLGITHPPIPTGPSISDIVAPQAAPLVPPPVVAAPMTAPAPRIVAQAPPITAPDPLALQAGDDIAGLNRERSAILAGVNAESQEGREKQKALGDYSQAFDAMKTPLQIMADHKAKDDELMLAYQNKTLDPNRYIHNMSTGSKIASGIALILGGMSAGTLGGKNPAMENINSAINRDIEAQKDDQSKAMNLWKMNREATGNDIEATLKTQNQMLVGVGAKLSMAAAKAQGPMARARIAPVLQEIDSKLAANRFQMAMNSPNAQNGGFMDVDPSLLVHRLVPKEQQEKVFGEIKDAQDIQKQRPEIMRLFDKAAEEQTVARRLGGLRGESASTKALKQSILPFFKEVEGTAKQFAVENTNHNMIPAMGDTAPMTASKKKAFTNWLSSKSAAPIAKGAGIDLNRFRSTSTDPRATFGPHEINIYNQAHQLIRTGIPTNVLKGQTALQKLGLDPNG